MILEKDLIFVGIIQSVHGIKGHVIVKSFTEPTINILNMKLVSNIGDNITLKLISKNSTGNLICKLNEISNRTDVEQLKGYKIFCLRSDLPLLDEDEFYIEDLKNLIVLDQNHQPIGKINNIFNFGAGDIIEIELTKKKKELLPFSKELFPVITSNYVILNKNT